MAELFDRFAVDRVPRWPLLSRLLALSVVLHGLFFVAVVYVPAARALLAVASAASGIKFVSEDYDRTLIGQRATIIKFEPHEKLYYPPDYFGAPEVAETTQLDPMMVQPAAPPPLPPPPIYMRPARRPRAAAAPDATPTPDETASATPTPAATPTAEEQSQAEAEMDRVAKETGVKRPPGNINTKPFEDIALKGKALFEQGKLDFNNPIEVTATGQLNPDGSLNRDTVRLNWVTASDQSTADLAQELITALSQSGVLVMLTGATEVRLSLKLDQQTVKVSVLSDLASEDEAAKAARGYSTLVGLGKMAKKGTNEGVLYENLKFNSAGKQFAMDFEMPKDAAGKIITDMLAKKAAAPAPQQGKS